MSKQSLACSIHDVRRKRALLRCTIPRQVGQDTSLHLVAILGSLFSVVHRKLPAFPQAFHLCAIDSRVDVANLVRKECHQRRPSLEGQQGSCWCRPEGEEVERKLRPLDTPRDLDGYIGTGRVGNSAVAFHETDTRLMEVDISYCPLDFYRTVVGILGSFGFELRAFATRGLGDLTSTVSLE